ncbi:hypothetical protein EV424DRAFT_278749, partial [Suillus variegatus]
TQRAFARIIATTGSSVTHLILPLKANLLAQFESSELVDSMNFIGLLIHKLQSELFNVLDELIGPLSAHITHLLNQPITGADDGVEHAETKHAYLTLLTNVMSSDLHDIFITDRNKATFEPPLISLSRWAEDISDSSSQKSAFAFLSRCVQAWRRPATAANGQVQGVPGFEQFVYEHLVPTAFAVLSSPQFN